MAKIEVTSTELVWPGKYNDDGTRRETPRVNLPFQVIETINESRVDREPGHAPQLTLFDIWEGKEGATFEEGWKNKLIWGDNLLVMSSLLEKFAGKVDLIYIDPPFATGADFSFKTFIGDSDDKIQKKQSVVEEKAYRDTWGKGFKTYFDMMLKRITLIYELLSPTGSLFVHLDPTVNHYIKIILDEIFGYSNESPGRPGFRNEIIWCYGGGGIPQREFPRKHDNICWFTKGTQWVFNTQFRPYSEGTVQRGRTAVKGKHAQLRSEGTPVNDWWSDIKKITSPTDPEKLYFDTQKSEALLDRICKVASNPGDLVADFFCGSGTTMAVAEKLGRRWIGCDLSRWAVHVTRKRLLEIENCRPFEILNLGKYERKYWQGVTFNHKGKDDQQVAVYQYIAFILRLYNAEPLTGMEHLHGKKGKAVVHVGAVDAPVTIAEIGACIEECAKLKLTELHVVGWEWEMGLAGPNNDYRRGGLMHEAAREQGVRLYLFQIPREVMEQQAVDRGDIQFFELAYLEAELIKPEKKTVQVALKDFIIPNSDLIPDEVRQKIKKWSDYIDYWAVDWNFQNDTFIQGWVSYRTRRDRKLKLTTGRHAYEKADKYRILLKVIDIFGNDTSQPIDVEVK